MSVKANRIAAINKRIKPGVLLAARGSVAKAAASGQCRYCAKSTAEVSVKEIIVTFR